MTPPDCRQCPHPCVRPDCPHAARPWVPGTDEFEMGAAHEPEDCGDEE